MWITSLGYHTFTLPIRLTVKEAFELLEAFKIYCEVVIISPTKGERLPWYFKIVYPGQEKGISWMLEQINLT